MLAHDDDRDAAAPQLIEQISQWQAWKIYVNQYHVECGLCDPFHHRLDRVQWADREIPGLGKYLLDEAGM